MVHQSHYPPRIHRISSINLIVRCNHECILKSQEDSPAYFWILLELQELLHTRHLIAYLFKLNLLLRFLLCLDIPYLRVELMLRCLVVNRYHLEWLASKHASEENDKVLVLRIHQSLDTHIAIQLHFRLELHSLFNVLEEWRLRN